MRATVLYNLNAQLASMTAIAALTAFATGCGDGRPTVVPVQGRVLIDGQPLTKGAIRVVPDNARAASGSIQDDGSFRLTTFEENDGCVPGVHGVEVVGFELLSHGTKRKWHAPVRYGDFETSGLSLDVSEPTSDVTINLTWGKEKPFVENLVKSPASGATPPEGTL